MNQTKIKGGCQSGRKVVPHNSKSDLPLEQKVSYFLKIRKVISLLEFESLTKRFLNNMGPFFIRKNLV